jgi:cell wall assembly regulator SMI1
VCGTQWAPLSPKRCGNPAEGLASAFFYVVVPPAPGTSQSWEAIITFSEDHDDGFVIVPAGTVTTLARVIGWAAE